MSSHLADYQYELPQELIADRPTAKREESRMLVLHKESRRIEHRGFSDLPEYLTPKDLLVLNDSKVIPARLRDPTGKMEILLLEQKGPCHWISMVRPGKKMRIGVSLEVAGTIATVLDVLEDGTRLIGFESPPDLERYGEMPIPPYFHRTSDEMDKVRYQTVYARDPGSVAAPTAGLHFTQEILNSIPHSFVTLHVGAGTFHPVKVEDLSQHRMHSEYYTLGQETAQRINETRDAGGKIVAVGTTTTRVLESQLSLTSHLLKSASGATDIFIRPPYQFRRVDSLLTNFHLPGSTLLMLISAFADRDLIMETYSVAIREKYRFFSYGDCMLIV